MSRADLIRAECATLSNTEQAVLLLAKAKVYLDQAKQIKELVDDTILEYIESHGSFEVAGVRYYAGHTKKTTVKDKEQALEALLAAVGGDLGAVVESLAAQPFKTGEMREKLGPAFEDHFKTEEVSRLKEGKPKKRLLTVEAKYVK